VSHSKQQSQGNACVLEKIERSGNICSIYQIKIFSVIFDKAKMHGTSFSETTVVMGHPAKIEHFYFILVVMYSTIKSQISSNLV